MALRDTRKGPSSPANSSGSRCRRICGRNQPADIPGATNTPRIPQTQSWDAAPSSRISWGWVCFQHSSAHPCAVRSTEKAVLNHSKAAPAPVRARERPAGPGRHSPTFPSLCLPLPLFWVNELPSPGSARAEQQRGWRSEPGLLCWVPAGGTVSPQFGSSAQRHGKSICSSASRRPRRRTEPSPARPGHCRAPAPRAQPQQCHQMPPAHPASSPLPTDAKHHQKLGSGREL